VPGTPVYTARVMHELRSYLNGSWQTGDGKVQTLFNPATEEQVANCCASGLDLQSGLDFARREGGPALRQLTLSQRGGLLRSLASAIHDHREELIDLAMINGGNTRSDAKFDIDGASGTLAYYAELAEAKGDAKILDDGQMVQLGQSRRFVGRHAWLPRTGVAVLINAFNFPAWGFGEKAACALLAGMPIIVKPATSTAWVAARLVELAIDRVPAGVISAVIGSAHELPTLLDYQDVISFTGSSGTAAQLRSLPKVSAGAVRLNVEADSLNAAVLGPDVEAGSDTYEMFLRDVRREATQKAGQKCTAIRRIFTTSAIHERVRDDLVERLAATRVGNPATEGVKMGPLATAQQQRDVSAGIEALAAATQRVLGADTAPVEAGKGYFVPVSLFDSETPDVPRVHSDEVFGPVVTLMGGVDDAATAGRWIAEGKGGLVCSVYSDDRVYAAQMLAQVAPHHGRVMFGSAKIAAQAPSPGTVLPSMNHGGPGRAGGGEELGGWHGVGLYSQRVAIQGARGMLDAMLGKAAK
jgi:oxepin-CoA hydrolase/3-oxo-5,6-dehydrosuberyl-CoA semialdehyde dehydrogenase